jgi:dipeptidyl aminopeptidase/acylaminoacyl peptidase
MSLELEVKAEQKSKPALNKAPWIKPNMWQPMTPIKFPSRDGTEIHGYLTRSKSAGDAKGPTVMLIHGGPFRRDSWEFNPEVQFLAQLGYHVIQVNYRGSSGFRKNYSISNLRRICKFAIEDVADAARWAIKEGIADPDRLAIIGSSFGGYAALAGAGCL